MLELSSYGAAYICALLATLARASALVASTSRISPETNAPLAE